MQQAHPEMYPYKERGRERGVRKERAERRAKEEGKGRMENKKEREGGGGLR